MLRASSTPPGSIPSCFCLMCWKRCGDHHFPFALKLHAAHDYLMSWSASPVWAFSLVHFVSSHGIIVRRWCLVVTVGACEVGIQRSPTISFMHAALFLQLSPHQYGAYPFLALAAFQISFSFFLYCTHSLVSAPRLSFSTKIQATLPAPFSFFLWYRARGFKVPLWLALSLGALALISSFSLFR